MVALAYAAASLRSPAAAPAVSSALSTESTVATDSSAPPPVAAAGIDQAAVAVRETSVADSERVKRARGSVLALLTSEGRGSAFAVDSTGLLFTAAPLVPRDQRIDVFVDEEHTVRATVILVDSASGLAAVRIAPGSCKRCRALDLGSGDTTRSAAAVGDTLLALSVVRRTTVTAQVAVVARTTATTLGTVVALAPSALGAPLFNARTGGVTGIVTRRRGGVTVVTAGALRALLASARPLAARLSPNDTLYRTWPQRAVAASDLDAAETRPVDLGGYRTARDGFDVLAMTPQVLAWRLAQSAPPPVEDTPFAIPSRTTTTPSDPLLEWRAWRAYRQERRAVVVLVISPERAAFPARPDRTLDARRGDFFAMSLSRDGTPLVPLESQRIPAVSNVEPYRRERKPVPNAGIYVFHPADFAASGATYQMEIVDGDKNRRVTLTLPAAMLQSIARDLAPWQK